jgi:2-polyprenyl-3-methyl-5-hydroxy-6-metoxy-1,4-benzoquinol methylase
MTTAAVCRIAPEVETRARASLGISDAAIYRMVATVLKARHGGEGVLVDVGCGAGQLRSHVREQFARYVGVDAVRYAEFPADAEFHLVDLDTGKASLPDACADAVAAVETIEHLENPRAFMRELTRLAKPNGLVVVTTPNQLSLLSLLTLVVKHRFSAFQDAHYPAHLTALLEVDLKRIAAECGLSDARIVYSLRGRIILTPWHYPRFLARLFPRALSDNLLVAGKKPDDASEITRQQTNA